MDGEVELGWEVYMPCQRAECDTIGRCSSTSSRPFIDQSVLQINQTQSGKLYHENYAISIPSPPSFQFQAWKENLHLTVGYPRLFAWNGRANRKERYAREGVT